MSLLCPQGFREWPKALRSFFIVLIFVRNGIFSCIFRDVSGVYAAENR